MPPIYGNRRRQSSWREIIFQGIFGDCNDIQTPLQAGSRRLGLSLGIDLIPFKTCSYDCAYCECGHTTSKIVTRQDFFPAEDVMTELRTTETRALQDNTPTG